MADDFFTNEELWARLEKINAHVAHRLRQIMTEFKQKGQLSSLQVDYLCELLQKFTQQKEKDELDVSDNNVDKDALCFFEANSSQLSMEEAKRLAELVHQKTPYSEKELDELDYLASEYDMISWTTAKSVSDNGDYDLDNYLDGEHLKRILRSVGIVPEKVNIYHRNKDDEDKVKIFGKQSKFYLADRFKRRGQLNFLASNAISAVFVEVISVYEDDKGGHNKINKFAADLSTLANIYNMDEFDQKFKNRVAGRKIYGMVVYDYDFAGDIAYTEKLGFYVVKSNVYFNNLYRLDCTLGYVPGLVEIANSADFKPRDFAKK